MIRYPAFYKWLKQHFGEDKYSIAEYIHRTAPIVPADSEIWKLLEDTGDQTFTTETFYKAAEIAIGRGK